MDFKRLFALSLLAFAILLNFVLLYRPSDAQQQIPFNIKEHYVKSEYQIPMRDGKKLFTVVYAPRDTSQKYPILMQRTPYGSGPYGEAYRFAIGPSPLFMQEGYIFVYQDVRGTFMSEGEFEDVRPHIPEKKSNKDIAFLHK